MKDVVAAIEAQLKNSGMARDEIPEIVLMEVAVPDMAVFAGLDSLESLTLCVSDVKTLAGFPPLPSLKRLEVTDNKIAGGFQALAESCPGLVELVCENNRVADMAEVAALAGLQHLKVLSLEGNPVAQAGDYRARVWGALPGLEVLDGLDADGNEAEADEFDTEDDEDDDEDDDADEPGLAALYGPADDDEDGGDFQAGAEEDSEDIDDDADADEDGDEPAQKRARYADDEDEDDDGDGDDE